jgi:diadenosine tetraphosphate (Ap4A) HIT family hydrolase
VEERLERCWPDVEAFHHGMRTKPCFVCEIVAGTDELPQHCIYADGGTVVYLDAYPRAYGYTLAAPKDHKEQATVEEYLDLQQVVYRVCEAVREEVGAERIYLYTFGSNQGGAHVHWHVVLLPPGVPYEEQQGARASLSKGVLKIPEEMASPAARIGARMA